MNGAAKLWLAVLRVGQAHPTFCLPPEVQSVRVSLAHGLFPSAQEEALQLWAYHQGNAGISTWSHSGRPPLVPHGARMYLDESVEFLRVSREGPGYIPTSPQYVMYRRWYYIDGTPRPDGHVFLPPEQDDLQHAWDRLLPGWRESTVPLPTPSLPPMSDPIWGTLRRE